LLGIGAALSAPTAVADPDAARAQRPIAVMSAAFQPKRLGASTTVVFAVQIEASQHGELLPVSKINVNYPSSLGLATSGLGLDACDPAALELQGPDACPANSKLGEGTAVVEVRFGPALVSETVQLEIYAVPSTDGYLHLGVLAEGRVPVIANVVISGVLSAGRLELTVPPVASLPGAPYVALVRMQASLGGDLTYFEKRGGRRIPYRPRGIGLPDSCPRGGWRLATTFQFIDGQGAAAATKVACPPRRRPKRG
jgi:hypothetical protein